MNIKVIDKKEEPLLSRTKITAELFFKGATPSKQDFKKNLASSLKSDENLIVVKKIFQNFGSGKSESIAYLYKNKEEMQKIEPKKKQKVKEKPKEEKKEPEKEKKVKEIKEKPKKEESKEEPKKKEKSEEKKVEEKK